MTTTSNANGQLLKLELGYGGTNNNGNVRSQLITVGQTVFNQVYTYDGLNRLKTATETVSGANTWSQGYDFDLNGNRYVSAGAVDPSFTPVSANWFNAKNRIVSTGGLNVSCDDAGNQTQMGSYASAFDGEGRRVMKTIGALKTVYVYSASGELMAEYSAAAPEMTGTRYVVQDQLGTVRLNFRADGGDLRRYDYYPFGEKISAGVGPRSGALGNGLGAMSMQFTGKGRDQQLTILRAGICTRTGVTTR